MTSSRNQLIHLIEQNCIPEEKISEALSVTKTLPDGKAWKDFIDHLFVWLGGMAIAFSAMFFIAYNWDALGRFSKFGMVETLIVISILAYWKLDTNKVSAKVVLLMAAIFLGVLLALYGQTYQTGADPWQLFFNWALLILPWAIIGRFPAIWVLWALLINISIVLYYMTFRGGFWFVISSDTGMLWVLFAINLCGLIVWEVLCQKWRWLSERWAIRFLATASGVSITWLVLHDILDYRYSSTWTGFVWVAWLVTMYYIYRNVRRDLFMLAGIALSGIIVVMSFMSKHILDDFDAGGFLVIALMIIGMGTGAAIWLRNIHREWQS